MLVVDPTASIIFVPISIEICACKTSQRFGFHGIYFAKRGPYLRLVDPKPVLVDVVENDGDERVRELPSPAS
jgi:hypothetical protein